MSNEENNIKNNKPGTYSAASIVQEEGAAKHRTRVSQFLGASDVRGIENLLFEMIDNSVDEELEYTAQQLKNGIKRKPYLTVEIKENGEVVVEDFGRGIPCEDHPKTGESAAYMVCESDSAGGKDRDTDGYSTKTAGTHGAGLAVSKSCTEYCILEIDSSSANGRYVLKYKRGVRDGSIQRIGDLRLDDDGNPITGTKVTYMFDDTIFSLTNNGKIVKQPYFKHLIVKRLEYMLLGDESEIEIKFKYMNDEPMIIGPRVFTPEKFLKDTKLTKVKVSDPDLKNGYDATIYLSLMQSRLDGEHKTIVNRLNTLTATTNEAVIDAVTQVLNDMLARDTTLDKKFKGMKVPRKLLKAKLSVLTILSIARAEFSGQTKQNFVTNRFIVNFMASLEKEFRNDEQFVLNVYRPMKDTLIQEKLFEEERKKVEERAKKLKEKLEEQKKADNFVEQLKTDSGARAKNKMKSRITIKDSPFPKNQSTLVYVEGKSAGGEFNELHAEGEVPIAIALIEGKMPNVASNAEMSPITIDNRIYCLEAGYKDIAILTDGDVDGNHIRILLAYQIYKFARHYLKEGRVYLVPAPYSKVHVRKPMALTLYGEVKAYPVGVTYTFSAKEHQSLVTGGARMLQKYKGLADSGLSPTESLKDRSTWIRIKPIIEEDIRLIEKVLEEKSEFKSIFMAEVYSGRQFFSKKVSNTKSEIELDSKEIKKLLTDNYLSESPEVMNYSDLIDRAYLKKFDII